MASFTFTREIAAPAETVFEVLTDHAKYSELTPLRKSVLEREGEDTPNGVGAIRKLTAVGPALREEVIAYEEPSRFSYTLLSGLPVRDHVGTVELTPNGSGTRMVYAVKTQPTVPVVGAVVVAAVKQGVKGLIGGVVAESERRASAADG
ncbi:MAG TPA: SRPBCC family protein [Solirubrobacterales bacterium]|nr:SRPBCC family protein [Solirubrobacterales bacterium]